MEENRKAVRYDIHVPLQISFEIGTTLELAFCLPAERERNSCVLARATVKTIRAWELPGEATPLYGIAVTIDRIDFAQPSTSTAA
jgi:hypothetical protein